jgi:hypothetical protein
MSETRWIRGPRPREARRNMVLGLALQPPSRSLDIWVVPDLVAGVNVPVFLMFRDFCSSHSLHSHHSTNPRWHFCRVLGRYVTATRRYSPPVRCVSRAIPPPTLYLSPNRVLGGRTDRERAHFYIGSRRTRHLEISVKSASGDRERHSLACRCLTP